MRILSRVLSSELVVVSGPFIVVRDGFRGKTVSGVVVVAEGTAHHGVTSSLRRRHMAPCDHMSGRLHIGQQIGSLNDEIAQCQSALESRVGGRVLVVRRLDNESGHLAPRLLLGEVKAAHGSRAALVSWADDILSGYDRATATAEKLRSPRSQPD